MELQEEEEEEERKNEKNRIHKIERGSSGEKRLSEETENAGSKRRGENYAEERERERRMSGENKRKR